MDDKRLNLRERQEQWEHQHLSMFASFSDQTEGRDRKEEKCLSGVSRTGPGPRVIPG